MAGGELLAVYTLYERERYHELSYVYTSDGAQNRKSATQRSHVNIHRMKSINRERELRRARNEAELSGF